MIPFSKRVDLPMTIFPFIYFYFYTASRIRIDTNRLEDERSTINLWPFLVFIKTRNILKIYFLTVTAKNVKFKHSNNILNKYNPQHFIK